MVSVGIVVGDGDVDDDDDDDVDDDVVDDLKVVMTFLALVVFC